MSLPLKLRLSWKVQSIRRWYYKVFHKIRYDFDGSMLPELGKGEYCSVIRRGDYIDIMPTRTKDDFIRLVPFQPNHGVMVEHWVGGSCTSRSNLDYHQLCKDIIFASNVEQLAGRDRKWS